MSGVAALVFANKPNASVQEVRNAILDGVDLAGSSGKVATSRRLNAYGDRTNRRDLRAERRVDVNPGDHDFRSRPSDNHRDLYQ